MRQLATTLVLLRRGDEILLAMKKHGHGQGHWNGAGGKVEPGETIDQTMIRECQEEIGVTPTRYIQMAELVALQLYKGEPVRNTCHTFICMEWQGEPAESDEMAPRWFAMNDIPYERMWPDTAYWLPQLLSGEKLRGTFQYDDDNVLQSHQIEPVGAFV